MPITEAFSGTQAATVGTEHVLDSPGPHTDDGGYQLLVDLSAMVAGDVVELRVKEKVLSAGTQRAVWTARFAHAQVDPNPASPVVLLLHGWDFTLKQTAGTGRSFPWSIRKVT